MHAAALLILPALAAAAALTLEGDLGAVTPDPKTILIRGVTYGGSGCPQGPVGTVISNDTTTMTLIFDEYVASKGPGIPVTDSRKKCQLNIDLLYPPGFQYSIFSADYRGYAALDRSVTGTQKSTYYFSGQTAQTSTQTDLQGPMNRDYLKHDEADNVSLVFPPCGAEGMLNINSQVRLTGASNLNGLLTTASVDSKFTQILYINWQRCTK